VVGSEGGNNEGGRGRLGSKSCAGAAARALKHQPEPSNTKQSPQTPTRALKHQPEPSNTKQSPQTPTRALKHQTEPSNTKHQGIVQGAVTTSKGQEKGCSTHGYRLGARGEGHSDGCGNPSPGPCSMGAARWVLQDECWRQAAFPSQPTRPTRPPSNQQLLPPSRPH